MLQYTPGTGFAYSLDPRTKLAFQVAFVLATVGHADRLGLLVLTAIAVGTLWVADLSIGRALVAYRFPLALVALGPLISGVTLEEPWFDTAGAIGSAVAGYQVVLALFVAGAYIHTTPVRETRAAIQWLVPGRLGVFLGAGMAMLFRLFPLLRADLRTIRDAQVTRLGDQQGWIRQAGRLGQTGLTRAFDRADRLSLALRARCFAWNPTLPPLTLSRPDWPVLALALFLLASMMI